MTAPLIDARGLSVAYGKGARRIEAVRNVSLEVSAGEVVGIVGESGSGKSTLARALVGLVPLQAGEVRIDGVSWAAASPKRALELRKVVQPVFQDPASALDPHWSVRQSLEEPLDIHRVEVASRAARVAAVLDAVRLDATVLGRKPSELSAGQKQRVNLARALILEPRVLVLDEPVSALDVSVQAQVLNVLLSLRAERGLALVFISHALDVVAHVASRLAVMAHGQFIEQGDTDTVWRGPSHELTRRLVAANRSPT